MHMQRIYTRSLSLPLTWSALKASEKGYQSSICNVLAQQTAGDKVNLPGTTTFPNWHFYRVVNRTVVAASFLCTVYYMRLNNLCNY